MIYDCNKCNFTTNKTSTWYSHLKSKKHLKFDLNDENEIKNILTNQNNFTLQKEIDSLKEKITFKEKLIEEKVENYNKLLEAKDKLIQEKENSLINIKEQYVDHIKTLKKENEFQKELINETGGIIKESMNTMSFVIKNYKDAPSLEKCDYSIFFINKEKFIKDMAYYNKNNIIEQQLGNIIISKHKKQNPEQQSIWSTDSSRQNYLIKQNNVEISKDNKKEIIKKGSEWIRDKAGTKMTKTIISPLLNSVKQLNDEHIKETNNKISKGEMNIDSQCKSIEYMMEMSNINTKIKNETLAKGINKYIAPHFSFSK